MVDKAKQVAKAICEILTIVIRCVVECIIVAKRIDTPWRELIVEVS